MVNGQQEGGFGELGLVVAIFAVADGTDGEDYVNVGTMTAQQVDDTEQIVGTFIDGQFLFLEEGGWAFLAVVDNLARLLQAIDVVGAQRQENHPGKSSGRDGRKRTIRVSPL